MTEDSAIPAAGDRLAKVIARSGLCSRRDAEAWIKDGRVTVNGKKVLTPAFNVGTSDKIKVDGMPLAARQGTRVWLYHKPAGLVVTEKDPEGRPTIFEALDEKGLPRVVSIGRLDINTEGLLLVTNDGGLKRVLELPATGWLRRYRVRAFGTVTQEQLDTLKDGIEIEGIQYGPIEAILERTQGSNSWLVLGLREGKNREVKNVLGALGLQVNRLIRVSYGPFQLGDLKEGEVEVVAARVLREQLGKRLAAEAGADFDSDMPEIAQKKRAADPRIRAAAPGTELTRISPRKSQNRFRFEDDETEAQREAAFEDRPRQDRPGRFTKRPARPAKERTAPVREERTVHFDDGTSSTIEVKPQRAARAEKRWDPDDSSARNFGRPAHHETRGPRPPRPEGDDRPKKFGDKKPYGDRKPFGDKKPFGDRPRREDGDRPARGGFGSKPYAPRNAEAGDRPPRKFGDEPFGSRPPRADGDRPRSFGDKKPFGARPPREDGDRPSRGGFGKKPYSPRNAEAGDRPARSFGDKKPYGTRPPREGGDRPARSYGDKPRSFGDKKPFAGKPGGRPTGDRPGGKPFGGKPGGGRPSGDRPRGPKKPRE